MHSAVLLAHQNEQLYKENQRQKRKRVQRRSYLTRGGVLTGAEAQQLIEEGETSHQEAVQDIPASGR